MAPATCLIFLGTDIDSGSQTMELRLLGEARAESQGDYQVVGGDRRVSLRDHGGGGWPCAKKRQFMGCSCDVRLVLQPELIFCRTIYYFYFFSHTCTCTVYETRIHIVVQHAVALISDVIIVT